MIIMIMEEGSSSEDDCPDLIPMPRSKIPVTIITGFLG